MGQWTPESVGDYASGTNHVLPTYDYARMSSGVSLNSFLKYRCITELFPQIHYRSITYRGRVKKAGATCSKDGQSGRARGPQESCYPQASRGRGHCDCVVAAAMIHCSVQT
jgi:hypothetical protein